MQIRAEEEKDGSEVRVVNESAFAMPDEARLVAALREQARPVVSLVVELNPGFLRGASGTVRYRAAFDNP